MDGEVFDEVIAPLLVCQDCHSIGVKLTCRRSKVKGEWTDLILLKCESCGRWLYTINEKGDVSAVKKWRKPKPIIVESDEVCEECGDPDCRGAMGYDCSIFPRGDGR